MKLILLRMNSDQESNNKDIEDFLLFPMGIHAPPYDWQFKRYALSKLVNDAEILRWTDWRELTILNFFTKIQNENSRIFEYQTCRHLPQLSNNYLCVLRQ
jgi:hypothetical protein